MADTIKSPYIFILFSIIYFITGVSPSQGLEMTLQWHMPKIDKTRVKTIAKPVKLQPEITIQIYEKQIKSIEPQNQISSFGKMQMNLIQARIFARKGLYPASMNIYEQLIRQYPNALDIRADYADVLLEYGNYEIAKVQIQHLLNHKSFELRGLQMMAVLYDRINLPSWTFPIYDNLLSQYPNNYAIWMDYANQRTKAGHWQKALDAYTRVLENDPENIYALRGVHNILREKRPALHAQFVQYSGSDGTVRRHHQYTWRYTLTKKLTFRALIDNINIDIPEDLNILSQNIHQITMEINKKLASNLVFTGRIFYYSGPVSDISVYGALSYHLLSDTVFQISYMGPSAWFDPIQAMENEGRFEEYQVMVSSQLFEKFRLNSSLAFRKYSLEQNDTGNTNNWQNHTQKNHSYRKHINYGDRLGIHMDISRRILYKPDTTLIMGFDQGKFSYNSDNMDVPMVLKENAYSFSTYIQDQPFSRLTCYLSAGYRWDNSRSLSGIFVNPGMGWQFTSQFQINFSYSWSSESTGVVQGSTQTYLMNGMIIF
jgi:hypothetical protein